MNYTGEKMNDCKQTDKYTWMLQQFSADFEIALDEPSAMLKLKELILSHDKNLLDDIQKLGELARRLTEGTVKIIEEIDRSEIGKEQ
jgi:hypothetical protein